MIGCRNPVLIPLLGPPDGTSPTGKPLWAISKFATPEIKELQRQTVAERSTRLEQKFRAERERQREREEAEAQELQEIIRQWKDDDNEDLARGTMATKSELISRGWTESLINKYLGNPDALRTNPHYKSGPPMRLYERTRVEPFEKEEWFLARLAKKAARSEAAQKAVQTKKNKILEWVDALDIKIPVMPLDALLKRAIQHYNEHHGYERIATA